MGTVSKVMMVGEIKPGCEKIFEEIIALKHAEVVLADTQWQYLNGVNLEGMCKCEYLHWFFRHDHAKLENGVFYFLSGGFKNYDAALERVLVVLGPFLQTGEVTVYDDCNDSAEQYTLNGQTWECETLHCFWDTMPEVRENIEREWFSIKKD